MNLYETGTYDARPLTFSEWISQFIWYNDIYFKYNPDWKYDFLSDALLMPHRMNEWLQASEIIRSLNNYDDFTSIYQKYCQDPYSDGLRLDIVAKYGGQDGKSFIQYVKTIYKNNSDLFQYPLLQIEFRRNYVGNLPRNALNLAMPPIKVDYFGNLDEVIDFLKKAQERNLSICCEFNGHMLYSSTISQDAAYKEVCGYSKDEYDELVARNRQAYEEEMAATKARETEYAKLLKENRKTNENHEITIEKVLAGLYFIISNPNLSHIELVEGLLKCGCNFNLSDLSEYCAKSSNANAENLLLFEGMSAGDIACGASVIINTRDNEFGRAFCEDRFFGDENDVISIKHFLAMHEWYVADLDQFKRAS